MTGTLQATTTPAALQSHTLKPAMSCQHAAGLRAPANMTHKPIYKEECTRCFDDQDMPQGIDVCLTCFNGGCVLPPAGPEDNHGPYHAQQHHQQSRHPLVVNIRRIRRPREDAEPAEPPMKMTKLSIPAEENPSSDYTFETLVRCYACDPVHGARLTNPAGEVAAIVRHVVEGNAAARQDELKAWEEEVLPCEHSENLHQVEAFKVEGMSHCSECDIKDNLWLCLTCGALSCGRKQFDGSGGNGHAAAHYRSTAHPLACKLGTITPEGTADVYCYLCDDMKLDFYLADHLATFGINVLSQQKTSKTMAELVRCPRPSSRM